MSDAERTPAPRRSARERKIAQKFSLTSPTKRKRAEEAEQLLSDIELSLLDESDGEDNYVAPKKSKGKAKQRGPPAPKKQRATKSTQAAPTKTPARRGRKPGSGATRATAKGPSEAKITDDNALFNTIMNPNAALQSIVEDYLESFLQSPQLALADVITCVLRCCGSNDSVDSDRVVDYDGIVDALDDFTEVLKEDEAPTYPLTSKHPMFKKFRKSLSEFLSRLVQASAELGTLYSSDLLMTIQAWVVAMSSSQLRSFRHTATVIALEIETALCEVAARVVKEAEVISRQREGERKRKGKGTGTGREKDFEAKAKEVNDRRAKLDEFLKEFFDGVFIHRYRDLDPSIRAECVQALGNWLKKFPAHYLDGQYLRYIGWVLSDSVTSVRLEAVRALVALYSHDDFIVSLQSFTDRFKPRLLEMASGDTDYSVRVAAVQVLSDVDTHGLLEEDQRSQLCLLVFDADPRVRRAVGSFVHGVWQEAREQRLVGKKKPTDAETDRAGLKALAQLLVQWGRQLDKVDAEQGDEFSGESSSQGDGPSVSRNEVSEALAARQKSRIASAIEALWDEVPAVSDWEAMLDLLLLDHSAGTESSHNGSPVSARRKKAKKTVDDIVVDEAWRLEEAEEATLLEVLVTALRKAKAEAGTGKKGEEETLSSDITRALIKSLPSLIAKHQTDENRIANVLLIPELMDMDMYLEMRMVTAYESLWDDITKQFLTHSSAIVLANSMTAIRHLMSATSLSNTNSTKILELEDELASSLRDAVGGRDELEVATFSEDESLTLGAVCARLCALAGLRDLTAWMDEDEGGKQSSAWDIVCALAERGRLGYKEEQTMVDRALHLLTLHVIWKARNLMRSQVPASELEQQQEQLREQRDVLLEKLLEYAVGTSSNTLDVVKRAAFQNLLTLYILFSRPAEIPEDQQTPLDPLVLTMTDEVQYRCAGFVQAEIERYSSELEGDKPPQEDGSNAGSELGSDSEDEDERPQADGGKGKRRRREIAPKEPRSRQELEQEYIFSSSMATFLRALRAGVIHIRHGAVLLAHYNRLGPAFDLTSKLMIDILREEGMYKDNGELVEEVIVEALKNTFLLLLDRVAETEKHAVALSKALSHCLLIRGAQLSVVRRLPGEFVVGIHTTLISWLIKRITGYESNKNKRGRKAAILLFRALPHLLTGIEPQDAVKIKEHLDAEITQANLEIPPSSKTWEPYRAYEKRLISASTREKGASKKARGKTAQSTEFVTTDEEGEVEGLVQPNGLSSQPALTSSRPPPRPAFRGTRSETEGDETMSQLTQLTEEERTPEREETEPTINGNHAATQSQNNSSPFAGSSQITPQSKKRVHDEIDTGVEDDEGATKRDATPGSEIIVRRKRVRH